ncbi:bZIP transcription factor 60 [Salvia miltiorrhiza]|uniref:bZIP transcription factor 60 n=1 Tax=Salvia miltiorrhiza TaxID=226208 RepID=UPI0025AD41F7|nr:bZIP transcription factor 60 [Salvia miltiorrhiza]
MVDRGVLGDELNIDWDNLLENLPDDLCFDLGNLPPADGLSTSPDSGCSLSIDDIEQYLLNDESYKPADEKDGLADEFVADVLLDCFPGSESDSDRVKDSSASPELVDVVNCEEEKEREKPQENGADGMQTGENCAADDDGDADDPDAKKLKRQLRNRDAAVRSRERKKMLVRDLEMKSKYYEAECKRLGILLQCCLAENQALRLSLHSGQAFDASRTKQESAVLLLESLLLGSLLGFLGIIYLLILPSQLLSALEVSLLQNVNNTERRSVARREAGNEDYSSMFHSFMMSKRCKASRSRMKVRLFSSRGDAASTVSGFLLVGHHLFL